MPSLLQSLQQEKADLKKKGRGVFDAAMQREIKALTEDEQKEDDVIAARLTELDRLMAVEERYRSEERTAPAAQVTDPFEAKAKDGVKIFASLGEQMQAIKVATVGGNGATEARQQLYAAASGANEAVDSEGGFLVQQDFLAGIEERMYATGEILSRVRQVELGPNSNSLVVRTIDETSRATGSRLGGIRGYWVDEAEAITSSKPKFGRLELKLKKVAALGYATDELLEDSIALNDIYTQGFADELMFLVEDAIIEGDGASKPLGIIGHAATVSIAKETGQDAASIVYENVRKMRARQWARSRKNSVWLINQEVEGELASMAMVVGTSGVPVYLPAGGISVDGYDSLYGRPVIPIEYASALGTVGDIILADLSQYVMIKKGGVKQATSMHIKFVEGEMAYRATYRCDGQPMWPSALTPFKATSGNTLSPIITLATRA